MVAEPTRFPCLPLGIDAGRHDPIGVQNVGIDNTRPTTASPSGTQLLADTGSADRQELDDDRLRNAVHIAWVTGGRMVPADERAAWTARRAPDPARRPD